MNIFGVGGWELILIIVIMLIVAGPKRMAQWAYTLGKWASKLRVMWEEVADSLQKELDESGIDVQVPRTPDRREFQRSLQEYGKQVMEETGLPKDELKRIQEDVSGVGKQVQQEMDTLDKAVKQRTTAPKNGSKQPQSTSTDSSDDSNSSEFGTWGGD